MILGPAHVDVVPVTNPEGWKHDPFGGIIEDGFMYGRGVLDMLYQVSTQGITFIKIKQEKIPLRSNIYLWIVPDEELMGEMGTNWFLKNHKDKLELSEDRETFALTEGAGFIMHDYFNFYGVSQKPIWKKLIFNGRASHGAYPLHVNNALVKASKAAQKFQEFNDRMDKEALDLTYVREIAKILSPKMPMVEDLLNENTFAKGIEELYEKDRILASLLFTMTKTTFSPTIIQAGSNPNIVPDKAELSLDIRAMPNVTEEQIENQIKEILGELGKEVIIIKTEKAQNFVQGAVSPADSVLFRLAKKIVKEKYPEIEFVPFVWGGATDARFCRLEGINCYELGISDPKTPLSEVGPAHGTNEKMDLASIDLYLEFLYKLVVEFNK